MKKLKVGVLGATGMVGQRFVTLLQNHPWFQVTALAASPRSAGKPYEDAVDGRWLMAEEIPVETSGLTVYAVKEDIDKIVQSVDFVFCALDLEKDQIKAIEDAYAAKNIPVVSNNSANRWTEDVPMIMPEINPEHIGLIDVQRKNRGWKKGFIVVKPNCSIQSYVPLLTPLVDFIPEKVVVTTCQAVSGAGKTLDTWPEMQDNVIPFIGGEEKKSEDEPMRIWGKITNGKIIPAKTPVISATCVRVAANDGHMAIVSVSFVKKPSIEQILAAWKGFDPLKNLDLPSSPRPFITMFSEDNRPQTRIDRDLGSGMGISVGRLREDILLDYKFVGLSHNTVRGAAGGAILIAELLKAKGFLE